MRGVGRNTVAKRGEEREEREEKRREEKRGGGNRGQLCAKEQCLCELQFLLRKELKFAPRRTHSAGRRIPSGESRLTEMKK